VPHLLLALVLSALLQLLVAAKSLRALAEANPLSWIRWTPPQDAFHRLRSKRKLLRAGNQVIGKTTAALAEVIWRCTGTHPHYSTHVPPIEAWTVCHSWSQSVAIMSKFRALCPPELIDNEQTSAFSIKNGYGKDNPTVVFKCGSVLRFKTTGQGGSSLASATLHLVLIDEPTTPDIYRELDRRLTRTGGTLMISLTPINMDCTWLEEMVEEGTIEEVHATLCAANLIPVQLPGDAWAPGPLLTEDGVPMDSAWIAEQWRITPSAFAPVVLDGEWNIRLEGIFFDIFDPRVHVAEGLRFEERRGGVRWCLGFDYAGTNREHGQVAVLAQVQRIVDDKGRTEEGIYVRDMVVASGVVTNRQFAALVLEMLERQGLAWRDLDDIFGDNPVRSRWGYTSNIETGKAIARHLGVAYRSLQPRIKSAKDGTKSSGMVVAGCRYLYERLAEGRLMMHPRCLPLVEAFQQWDQDSRHPAKDRIDALRYALKGYIFDRSRGPRAVLRVS